MNETQAQWIHVAYPEQAAFTETYGFAGTQGAVNLEAVLLAPRGRPSRTLVVMMHPASTLQLLPVPRKLAEMGVHVLCAASRYAKNDTALIMENVIKDLGAHIRHAKQVLGYEKIVLLGWSGGGSLSLFYQSQAEHPDITATPAGDPVELALDPADAVICQAVHLSRPRMLLDMIDPSVMNELDPGRRKRELDLYDPANPAQPPYSSEFMAAYRQAQRDRICRITDWVKTQLDELRHARGERERCFITHRTLADPRYLDPALDPNGRRPGWCYLGNPETVNTGPVGLARFSTLRSWLSQWSIDDSRADGLRCAARISVPFLAIENCADDCVPQPHMGLLHGAVASADKSFVQIEGATHFYAGQPELLDRAAIEAVTWLQARGFGV
jgi:hypothetical protein